MRGLAVIAQLVLLLTTAGYSHGSSPALPCTIYVARGHADSESCGTTLAAACGTIQQGVWRAQANTTTGNGAPPAVCVVAGDEAWPCPASGVGVVVNASMTITAINGTAVLDCAHSGRAFNIVAGPPLPPVSVTLRGFTVRNGRAEAGGAVAAVAAHGDAEALEVEIDGCVFESCATYNGSGGAVWIADARAVRLTRSRFMGNQAIWPGCGDYPGFIAGGAVAVAHTRQRGPPPAVSVEGARHQFVGNTFENNTLWGSPTCPDLSTQPAGGGALAFLLTSNLNRGGVLSEARNVSVVVANNTFTNNVAGSYPMQASGGALMLHMGQNSSDCSVSCLGNTFINNSCNDQGGAVALSANDAEASAYDFVGNRFEANALVTYDNYPSSILYGAGLAAEVLAANDSVLRFRDNLLVRNTGCNNFTDPDSGCPSALGAGLALQLDWVTNVSLEFVANRFEANAASQGAGVFMECNDYDQVSASFLDNAFLGNEAQANGGGLALFYGLDDVDSYQGRASLVLDSNVFHGNNASSGGAALIQHAPDRERFQCNQWLYRGSTTLTNSEFLGNAALGSGGALFLTQGTTTLSNCSFHGNQAMVGGGLSLNSDSTAISIDTSLFADNRASFAGHDLWSGSFGAFTMTDSTLQPAGNSSGGGDREGLVLVIPHVAQAYVDDTRLTCAPGQQVQNQSSLAPFIQPCQNSLGAGSALVSINLGCASCASRSYNLVADSVQLSTGDDDDAVTTAAAANSNYTCHDCPGGADCPLGGAAVRVLPGFWCQRRAADPSALQCFRCPPGYCSSASDHPRPWDDACVGRRTGPLCGQCAAGFSEAFGTVECAPDDQCDDAAWLVPVALVVGAAYVLLVLCFQLRRHPLWKSITYFMQVVPLIASLDNPGLRATIGLFALDPSAVGLHLSACPWPGTTAVAKMTASYDIPAVLLAELALVWLGHRVVVGGFVRAVQSRRRRGPLLQHHRVNSANDYNNEDDDDDERQSPKGGDDVASTTAAKATTPYAAAGMALGLLLYQSIAGTTLALLHCVEVDGVTRLFRSGAVECFAGWQWGLVAVLALIVAPFPLLLLAARIVLGRYRATSATARGVLGVLEGPYRPGRRWWESANMARRLVLAALATFVVDPVWRAMSLFGACLVALLFHVHLAPFASRAYGSAETAFLAILAAIAALQGPLAAYAQLGAGLGGSTATIIANDVQVALTLLPLAYCALVALWLNARWLVEPLLPELVRRWLGFIANDDTQNAIEELSMAERRFADERLALLHQD
jgi:hypothetical protein